MPGTARQGRLGRSAGDAGCPGCAGSAAPEAATQQATWAARCRYCVPAAHAQHLSPSDEQAAAVSLWCAELCRLRVPGAPRRHRAAQHSTCMCFSHSMLSQVGQALCAQPALMRAHTMPGGRPSCPAAHTGSHWQRVGRLGAAGTVAHAPSPVARAGGGCRPTPHSCSTGSPALLTRVRWYGVGTMPSAGLCQVHGCRTATRGAASADHTYTGRGEPTRRSSHGRPQVPQIPGRQRGRTCCAWPAQ